MLWVCDDLKVDAHTRRCTVLTGYAESDYNPAANDRDMTFGVYQQDPRYWPTAHMSTLAQCVAFIDQFTLDTGHHNGDPVHDCWVTQRWNIPSSNWPDPGPGFEGEKTRTGSQTYNYARRVPLIDRIITERKLP